MSIIRTYPSGYAGASQTWAAIRLRWDVRALNPEFRRRVHRMMLEANKQGVSLGIGGGARSAATTDVEFRRRHYVDPVNGSIFYLGVYWSRHSWAAPLAPPDRTWHADTATATGAVAADMVGDLKWMDANAGWFGLRTFTNVGTVKEPWHCQPVEIPTARVAGSQVVLKRWFK